MKRISLYTLVCALLSSLLLPSCTKEMDLTTMIIQDSIRHYHPLVQGTDLIMRYRIANIGDEPLVLTDVQPSCGGIVEDPQTNNIIPPGQELLMKFKFQSDKYSGFVKHSIRLFGNIYPEGIATISFDLDVIPPALGSPDYEERHKGDVERAEDKQISPEEEFRETEEHQRHYWTNPKEYPHGHHDEFWNRAKE